MPECYICGRATVMDDVEYAFSAANVNICTRAGCEPERRFHEEQRNEEMMDHWAIITRFKNKAETEAECNV